jgi:hypothetical protein
LRARDSGCVALREECRGGGGSYGGGPGRVTLAVGHPGTPVPMQPRAAGGPRSPGGASRPSVGGAGRQLARRGSWPLWPTGRGQLERGSRAKRATEREARGPRGVRAGPPFRGTQAGAFERGALHPEPPPLSLPMERALGQGAEYRHIGYSPVGSGAWRATSTATFRAPAWAGLCMGGSMHRAPSMAVASGESPALGARGW